MNAHIYPIIIGIIFCLGLAGAIFCSWGDVEKPLSKRVIFTLLLTLFFCAAFAFTFESYGVISSTFALCLTLGVIWCERYNLGNLIVGVALSALCSAGIWVVMP